MTKVRGHKLDGRKPRNNPLAAGDKQAMVEYYEAGLKTGRTSDDLLFELAELHSRSTRQISRYVGAAREARQEAGQTRGGGALIRKWRRELKSYTPVHLARLWLKEALRETAQDSLSSEESKGLYHEAQRPHFQGQITTGLRLEVESDPGFRSLRQRFPTSSAWAQLDVWRKQVIPYLNAYWGLLDELQTVAQSLHDRENSSASGALLFLGTRRVVCILALAMACNLLAKGLEELPGDVRHGLLITELSKLQAEIDLEILLLTNQTTKGGLARDTERIWTDPQDTWGLIQRTRECLSSWIKLQSVQDSLLVAIQEMESNS